MTKFLVKSKGVKKRSGEPMPRSKQTPLSDNLSEDICVLMDLTSPYGNIDRVIIGKFGGLFLIETKYHHGDVSVQANSKYLCTKTKHGANARGFKGYPSYKYRNGKTRKFRMIF